jgi:hypothetical protein
MICEDNQVEFQRSVSLLLAAREYKGKNYATQFISNFQDL